MKFCILMPAYNAANDIEKAVKSVLDQTFPDFCLIVVNDGSTDNTEEILARFSDDNRVKIVCQKNTGISGAYQRAFEYIDGDYIMFLDSDDAFAPDTLKEISDVIAQTGADIVQFGISYFDEYWQHKKDLVFPQKEIFSNRDILLNYFEGINAGKDRPNLGIRAYKRELFSDFLFPSVGSLGIDEILNLFCMSRCNKITFVPKAFYLCQQRANSVSRVKPSVKKVSGVLLSYKEMERVLSLQHSEYMDLLSIKFVRFYVSHLNIIKKLPTYKTNKKDFKRFASLLRRSSRVDLSIKLKVRIFLAVHFPFLSAVLSKN